MNVKAGTVAIVDRRVGAGSRTLRAILHRNEAGEPEALTLALGFGGADTGEPFTRPAWGEPLLQLPPGALEPLRDALAALLEAVEP